MINVDEFDKAEMRVAKLLQCRLIKGLENQHIK